MENVRDIIIGMLGKIFLTKKTMLGLDENKIVIVVSPSLKIYVISTYPKRLEQKLPFHTNEFLNLDSLKKWADDNGYKVTHQATTPKLSRKLLTYFGEPVVEGDISRNQSEKQIVLEQLQNSHLPKSIQEWAQQNPEKFIENIKLIQEMLKKN